MTGHQHQNNQRLGGQHQSLSFVRFPQVSQLTSRNEIFHWRKYLAEKFYQILAACQQENSRRKHVGHRNHYRSSGSNSEMGNRKISKRK